MSLSQNSVQHAPCHKIYNGTNESHSPSARDMAAHHILHPFLRPACRLVRSPAAMPHVQGRDRGRLFEVLPPAYEAILFARIEAQLIASLDFWLMVKWLHFANGEIMHFSIAVDHV